MDKLTRHVKDFARQVGADIVGIAGKECFSQLPGAKPDEILSGAQSVVVMGVRRNSNTMFPGGTWNAQEHYLARLTFEMQILLRTSHFIEDKGFLCNPISHHGHTVPKNVSMRGVRNLSVTADGELLGGEEFSRDYLKSMRALSHMHVGVEAGLGEIGYSRALVTPQFGPRVALFSVVTTAPLEPDSKLEEPVCKKDECCKCIEACRSGALKRGINKMSSYDMAKCMVQMGSLPSINTIRRGDQAAIERHLIALKSFVLTSEKGILQAIDPSANQGMSYGGCGICVIACPVGRKNDLRPRWYYGTPSVSLEVL